MIASPPVLAWYDPKRPTRVSSDACMYGAGALLEQQQEDKEWRPVHFMSASFTETQLRYSMVEKEACAIVMACERFAIYLVGLPHFVIRTDHKPLVAILQTKQLGELPVRLQRFRMRLTQFWYSVEHIPGKENYLPDTLSRLPLATREADKDILYQDSVELNLDEELVTATMEAGTPMTSPCFSVIEAAQLADPVSQQLRKLILNGWPHQRKLPENLKIFYEYRGDLSLVGQIITFQNRFYIPQDLRLRMAQKVHEGHFTLEKCLQRAKLGIWWPNIKAYLTKMSEDCPTCIQHKKQRPEPLLQPRLPTYPWDIIGADIGTYDGVDYLVVIDAYSAFPFYFKLTPITARVVIDRLKSLFHTFGSPQILRTDRGKQFDCVEFQQFVKEYDFEFKMSSSEHHQSNGLAETGVKIVKIVMDKNPKDPAKALHDGTSSYP